MVGGKKGNIKGKEREGKGRKGYLPVSISIMLLLILIFDSVGCTRNLLLLYFA